MLRSTLWFKAGGILAVGAAVISCATSASAVGPPGRHRQAHATRRSAARPAQRQAVASTATPQAAASVTSAGLPKMSARQLAGQRVIYSYSGLNPPAGLLWLIRHGEAAGVIFFGQNIHSEAQIATVIKKLEAADAAATNPVHSPLLLMTDQEGGEVRRLPGAPDLSEKEIGDSAHPAAEATAAGQGAAANLRGVGMNVNLAPVLDVYRTAGDFDDQFQRSYSKSPHKVSYLGADFIKAQQKGGVAATAKHFPGLGAATKTEDTDVQPVTLNVSKTKLRSIDEYPYKAAIAAGVKLVMVSWAVYPSLGTHRPAGLATKIVQGELRDRLGFKGVTITDALEAGALKAYGSIQNRALLAGEAGMDLVLCAAQNVTEGDQCMDGLENGYNHGQIAKSTFKAAVSRVLALRAGLPK